jgi:3-hydroxybutyryl-CoA dehydratase
VDSAPTVEPVVKHLTQESINRYADATGDYNPIHVDEAYARATSFGGTIAHGMLVLAAISEMMSRAFGQDWLASGRLKVRFKGAARPGDTVTAQATPRPTRAGAEGRVLEYAVECRNQRGETLISGTAEVRVPSGEGAGRE